MMMNSVLLDTCFFIDLFNPSSPRHGNAVEYFHYFTRESINMYISTISIAEFCVIDKIESLPLDYLKVLPFNVNHAQKAGELIRETIEARKKHLLPLGLERVQVPNDSKLFAQADVAPQIDSYVSADVSSEKIYSYLKGKIGLSFKFIDINTPCSNIVGELPFSTANNTISIDAPF